MSALNSGQHFIFCCKPKRKGNATLARSRYEAPHHSLRKESNYENTASVDF